MSKDHLDFDYASHHLILSSKFFKKLTVCHKDRSTDTNCQKREREREREAFIELWQSRWAVGPFFQPFALITRQISTCLVPIDPHFCFTHRPPLSFYFFCPLLKGKNNAL